MTGGRELTEPEKAEQRIRKERRIADMQLAPVKQLPMLVFMSWMSGNEIAIFTIMILYMIFSNGMASLRQTNQIFAQFDGDASVRSKVTQAKMIYIAASLAFIGFGLLKLSWMGLLPVQAADWMEHTPARYLELSSGHVMA